MNSTGADHFYVGPSRLSDTRYNDKPGTQYAFLATPKRDGRGPALGAGEVTTLSVSYDGVAMITRWERWRGTQHCGRSRTETKTAFTSARPARCGALGFEGGVKGEDGK